MKILLTGTAGFVGAAVAGALLDRHAEVVGLDSLNSYYAVSLKEARLDRLAQKPGFSLIRHDLAQREQTLAMVDSLSDVTGIVHMAAQAGVRHSLVDPWSYLDANVTAHLNLLELARRLPKLRHVVYASSSSVYGANRKLPASVEDRVDEPLSLYAVSKRAGELMSQTYARLHGLALTGLRFFTVYGPWGRPDMSPIIFTKALLAGEPITLYGDGQQRRDFTYIDDIVPAVLAALERPPEGPVPHRLYNLGNDRAEKLNDLLCILEKATGQSAKIERRPALEAEPHDTWADIGPARRDLGFDPKTTIAEGLPRLVAWYREFHRL